AKLTSDDEVIDWSRSSDEIARQVRALFPTPGATTTFRGKRLKVLRVSAEGFGVISSGPVQPGELVAMRSGLYIATGLASAGGWLELKVVQPEGKRPMQAKEFLNGYRPQPGERLG
ncbi:MAG TPA: methionyl-tRNA formyltransferase, partial [Actinomycetota bacterium]|nr:methionyl-tRNA formyltransferase [Actinomycetota bacterium]